MRLVHLSDLHFGAVAPARPEALRAAVTAASPELVVVSGDLSQRGRRREFMEAREFLQTLPTPQLIVPGNHDLPRGVKLWHRFRHPWRLYRSLICPELEPCYETEELAMVGVNSARPGGWYLDWSRGRLSGRQLIQMRSRFKTAGSAALRVLVVHHPPAAPPQGTRRHLIDRRPALFGALNEAGVDLVLAGHFHLSYAVPVKLPGVHPRHCLLSVTSTATSHRLKGEPNGFHVIEGNRRHLQVQAWSWKGDAYQPASEWNFARADDGDWQPRGPG